MGGDQGIGKDALLEPVKHAVGPWNFKEISPKQMFGRFNGFLKSVILRVSEVRDLGEVDRYSFYEHLKTYTASPPDVLRVDEKFIHEYPVFNVCGVVFTSNHKTDGIYLPKEDRRHYVAWSPRRRDEFEGGYWSELWNWYSAGGTGHVAAYLRTLDLSAFDPKAPPRQTEAFFDIVHANGAPEDVEMADVLDLLGRPEVVTIPQLVNAADQNGLADFALWMRAWTPEQHHRILELWHLGFRNPN